ncbi:wax ester synthase/diacylglycerol acyltransferase 11-like isoform X1 [Macadamia integrifolia]|uniref:wax ester synthase/diacylglycerol acyltransferase 11-like isoform X1 n=1 Tax=Macadamia integrifolia TaxID=60698 RepID=UPI001C4ECD24|nr:wax ester synthase/diacylglycerol acyltransferase 11-like isoform X1 [Macadamia integrifolia]
MVGVKSRREDLRPIVTKSIKKKITEDEVEDERVGEGNEQPLSPASRLFHEPHFNCYILAIMGCTKRVDPDIVKAGLETTLLRHPTFSSIQVVSDGKTGEMSWIRVKVDLEKHVIVPEIEQGMDSHEQFVEHYISNLSRTTIDTSRPLWDLHILNVKTSEAESVSIFRIHHSLGDGTSLMSLLLACTRRTDDPEALPTVPTQKKRVVQTRTGGFSRPFLALWELFLLIWNTMVDVLMFIATLMFLKDTETPLKGPPGVEFTPKRFVHRTVSLDDIKFIKNSLNMTINDVALGITQAGLSRYLNRRYCEEKLDKGATEKKNNLPKKIRLRAALLVNIRPSPGIQALADMMEKDKTDAKWGNCYGYVLLPFRIALRNDPLDYVREAKATIDRKKHSYEAIYSYSGSDLTVKLFGFKVASALCYKVMSRTTMSFTNLVGPVEEICFYGHPLAFLAPSVYGHPHALTINYQSYMNKMTFVLAIDPDVIPDPQQLCSDLEESLKLIKNTIISKAMRT